MRLFFFLFLFENNLICSQSEYEDDWHVSICHSTAGHLFLIYKRCEEGWTLKSSCGRIPKIGLWAADLKMKRFCFKLHAIYRCQKKWLTIYRLFWVPARICVRFHYELCATTEDKWDGLLGFISLCETSSFRRGSGIKGPWRSSGTVWLFDNRALLKIRFSPPGPQLRRLQGLAFHTWSSAGGVTGGGDITGHLHLKN